MSTQSSSLSRALHWTFDSRKTGRVTIGQFPNIWLWTFLGAVLVQTLVRPAGTGGRVVSGVKYASLTIWGLDEMARGVNPWRRFLGALAVVGALISWLNS